MKHILWIIVGVVIVLSGVSFGFTFMQVREEKATLSGDLEYRTRLLADSLKESIEPAYSASSSEALQRTVDRFTDNERLRGLVVVDPRGEIIAVSENLPASIRGDTLAPNVMDADSSRGEFIRSSDGSLYVFAVPLHEEQRVVGALLLVQNADFINTYITRIWWDNLTRLVVQVLFFSIVIAAIVRWVVVKPLSRLAESVRRTRAGRAIKRVTRRCTFASTQ